ncbi:MAG: HPF/RaiA family ribosome-associated protein [Bdellovibrionales bacterium]
MDKVQIEWGGMERSEAVEKDIFNKASKILSRAQMATHLIVNFKITNPISSAGPASQKVSMNLRLPHHQDIHAEREGDDLYKSIKETQQALLTQIQAKKDQNQI